MRRERAGRSGKTVTVAAPLLLARDAAESLLADLKRRCGSGGALKLTTLPKGGPAWSLEIQGDHADRIVEDLCERGFRAKRAGG